MANDGKSLVVDSDVHISLRAIREQTGRSIGWVASTILRHVLADQARLDGLLAREQSTPTRTCRCPGGPACHHRGASHG